MKLIYRELAYSFRSRGLFLFLRLLKDAYPNWVDMAGVESRLPGISPRQLARFIDLLEAVGLPLVSYETKTRGRFRLVVEAESVAFSGDPEPLPGTAGAAPLPAAPILAAPLAVYQDKSWVAWAMALIQSILALHEGHLSGKDSALDHLDTAEAAADALPSWAASVVHVRRAFVLERQSRFRDAAFWLRRVDTAARQGHAHPAARARGQLVRSKMRYDQARFAEAERLLDLSLEPEPARSPHWLNQHALILGRKFLAAGDSEAPLLLGQTLAELAEAFGGVFLWHGDTSLLDGLCYNFGNNLLRGIKRGLVPESCADVVLQWLATNMLVCRKLGIGDDSVLASLLLIDVGLDHGYSVKKWPVQLRRGLNISRDIGGLLAETLSQARRTGNRLEIAQCLRRRVRLATSPDEAKPAYFEAVELFGALSRMDVIDELAETWSGRFGCSPPTLRGRRHGSQGKGEA